MLRLRRGVKVVVEEEELALDKGGREAIERILLPREEEGARRPHARLGVGSARAGEAAPAFRPVEAARPDLSAKGAEVGDVEGPLPLKCEADAPLEAQWHYPSRRHDFIQRTHAGLDVKWRQRCAA